MIGRVLWIIPPLAVGVGAFMWMNQGNERATRPTPQPVPLAVRAESLGGETFQASAVGYGYVQPVRTWSAVAQVSGRAIELADNVAEGAFFPANQQAVAIDPLDYEIAQSKAEASLLGAQIALQELAGTEENTQRTLELERELEAVFIAEVERQQSLVDRGSTTEIALETAQKSLLSQQRTVLSLENSLALIPVQRQSLEATIATLEAEVREAETAIENTEMFTPFAGRVRDVAVAQDQFVRSGDTLFSLEDISASDVVAEFQPSQLSQLFRSAENTSVSELLDPQDAVEAFSVIQQMGLSATVSLTVGDVEHAWDAELIRVNGVSSTQTGTIGIVVRVQDPGDINPQLQRPPLSNSSFVKVSLVGTEISDVVLIDRDAVRYDGDDIAYVYVADANETLARRDLSLGSISGNEIVVLDGLAAGDTLILSNPQPALIGMPLNLVMAE